MRIVLFGPPGVGKGSQAALLNDRLGLRHISTGVILRAAIREGTSVGNEARKYVQAGLLVPGVVVRRLAEDELRACGYERFVLDGYPRTIEQADWLAEFLAFNGAPLDGVLSLRVPDEIIVDRLSKRRVDPVTGENYHLDFRPPPPDLPVERVVQRSDDRPEAIRKRLRVYSDETSPVQDYYRQRGGLIEIDGVGSFEEVHERIVSALTSLVG